MANLVNIYSDKESAIIVDESSTTLTQVESFTTLGESPFNTLPDEFYGEDQKTLKNLFFIELNIFDVDNNLIVSLNSARPLLKKPSNGKFYFGDFHLHNDVYMEGAKHTAVPHEVLEVVKMNQFTPIPIESKIYATDYTQGTKAKSFAIKTNEIFNVLKDLENFNLVPNTQFIIEYGIFQDAFLLVRNMLINTGAIE